MYHVLYVCCTLFMGTSESVIKTGLQMLVICEAGNCVSGPSGARKGS